MARKATRSTARQLEVETITHSDAKRPNIPTAELESVMEHADKSPIRVAFERRNRDLDPQLVWRGKDEKDWSDLVVHAPPLYIQEKVHPKVLVDDLLRQSRTEPEAPRQRQLDLFADFNGVPEHAKSAEFYKHDANWTNRMILGDSLQVMATLAEREGLRGKVQCIYFDPPYGIKFNSNFQWSTTSRDVKDGKTDHITREPEQVKAFRDTWRDGIHSYLTYLRDRLTVARDLLTESGSIFVQIGDENVHRVRAVMDEVFGDENCVSLVTLKKTTSASSELLPGVSDYVLWYAKARDQVKYRKPFLLKVAGEAGATQYRYVQSDDTSRRQIGSSESPIIASQSGRLFSHDNITSQRPPGDFPVEFEGRTIRPPTGYWKTGEIGMARLRAAKRLMIVGKTLRYVRFLGDFPVFPITNLWEDTVTSGFDDAKLYVVQTNTSVVERCILMATDPGDLVLDPTCGSGTTATVAEQWGRRWITIDTSRVALALARARIMGARYPYYLLADTPDGRRKEFELRGISLHQPAGVSPRSSATDAQSATNETRPDANAFRLNSPHGNIRHGFVYERVPHITLKSIANNAEIDVIWDKWQATLEPLRAKLNQELAKRQSANQPEGVSPRLSESPPANRKQNTEPDANAFRLMGPFEEWEIPREAEDPWPSKAQIEFTALRSEQAKGQDARPHKIADSLLAINSLLKRSYTLETLPQRAADPWPAEPARLHADWWAARIARQKEIDASIAAKAEFEYLYDKPYQDKSKVRVAGPFTVESLSPHRVLTVDEDDDLIDSNSPAAKKSREETDFAQMVLDHLLTSGVQQAHKEDRIRFTSVTPWPGHYIAAEGRYTEGDADDAPEKRAGIFIGPEFGTVARGDLVTAAREAGDAGFDVLIACAFNFDAHSSEFDKLGRVPVLKARMNADLHMAGELKNTGSGNLFVIFGEPDIAIYEGGSEALKVESRKVAEQVVALEKEAAETGRKLAELKRRLKDLKKKQPKETSEEAKARDKAAPDPLTEEIRQCETDLANTEKLAAEIDRKLARCARFTESTADIPKGHIVLVVYGVDVFKPQTGEVTSDNADGIACWFIDTDYNEESFFVRHAYFLGQNDPYKALKTTLKADINAEVWESLNSDTSRPFQKPLSGRIAVKVINHLGDEVMKVFRVR